MSNKKRNLLFQIFIFACSLMSIISQVFELTEVSFDLYTRDKDVMLVEFIMPWCRHCQALQPEWEKATQILAENREYVMGKVNCWESGKSLCDKLKIAMYPEIRLYRHGVYTETYEGERTAAALLDFVQRAQATAGHVGPPATSSILQAPVATPPAPQQVAIQPAVLKPTMPPLQYPQYNPTPQSYPPAYPPEMPSVSYSSQPNQPPLQQQLYPPKVQLPPYYPPPPPPRLPPPMRQVPQPYKPLAPPYLPPTPPKMVVTSEQFYTTPLSGAYQAPPGAINLPIQTISAKPDQEFNFYETIVPPPPNSGSNFQVQEMPMGNFQPPNIASASVAAQRLGQTTLGNGQFIPGRETQAFEAPLQTPSLPNIDSLYGPQREVQGVPADVYSQNGNTLWGLNNHLPKLRNENNQPLNNFVNFNQQTPYENYLPPSPQSQFQPFNQFPPSPPRPYTKAQNPSNAHSAPSLWNFFQSMAFNQPGLPTNPQQMIRNQPLKSFKPFYDRPQTYPTAFAKNKVFSAENTKDGVQITEEAKQKFENLKHLFSIMPLNAKQKFTSDQLHAQQQQQHQQQQQQQQQHHQQQQQQQQHQQQQQEEALRNLHRSVKLVDLPPYGNFVGDKQNVEGMSPNIEPSTLNPLGYFKPRPIFEQPILTSPSNDKFLPGVVRSKNPVDETEGPGFLVNYPKPSLYGQLHKKKPMERFIKRPLVNGIFTVQKELPVQLTIPHNTWSPSIKNNPSGINQHRHALLHIENSYIKKTNTQPGTKIDKLSLQKSVEEQQAINSRFNTNKIHLIVEEPRTDQALIRAKVANRYQASVTKARLPFGKIKGKSLLPVYKKPLNSLQALLVSNPQLYKSFLKLSSKPRSKEHFSSLHASFLTNKLPQQNNLIEPFKLNGFRPFIKSKLASKVTNTNSYSLKPMSLAKSPNPSFIGSRKLPSSILRLNPFLNNALLRDRALTALRNKVDVSIPQSLSGISKPVVSKKFGLMQNAASNSLSQKHSYETASLLMSNLNSDILKHSKMSAFFPLKKNVMTMNSPGNVLIPNVGSDSYKKSPVKVEKGTTRYIIKPQPFHTEKKQDFEGIWDKLYEFYSKKKSYLKKADEITAQQKANTRSLANNSIKRNEKLPGKANTISGVQYQTNLKKNAVINQRENTLKLNAIQVQPIDEKETQTYNNNNKRTQKSENKNSIDDKDIFLKAITRDPRPWDKRAKVTFQISRKSSIPGKPKVVGVWGSLKKRRKRLTKQKRKKRREVRSVRGVRIKSKKRSIIKYG